MERLERGKQGLIVGMAIVFAVSAAVKFKAELGDTAAAIREWANSTFTSGDAPAWGDVTGKPFSTIGSGATVVRDALTIEAPFWREVEEKPFSTIGEGLAVDGEVLVAKAQTPLWSAVTSKPFSIIGDGLLVENDVVVPGGYLWSSGDYDTVQVNQDMIYEISFAGTYGKWFAEFDIIPHYTNFRNNRYRFYERYRISGHSSGADWCNIEEVTYLGGSPYFEGLRLIGVREQAYGNLYLRFYSRQSNDMQGCEIAVRSYGGMTLRKGKPVMVASYNDSPTAPLNDIAYMKKAPGVEGKFTMFGLQNMIGHKYQLLGWQILSRSQYTKFPRYLELDLVHGAWDVESRRPNSYKYIHGFGVNKSNLLSTLVLDSLAGFKIDSIVALQNGDTMFFYAEYVPPTNKPAMYTMVDNFKEVGWPNGGTYLGNPFEVNTNFYEEPITTNERPWRYDACTWVSTSVPQYSGEASTWAEVKEKPFTSIGSGLSVIQKSDTDFELYVTNDVYPSWDNVSGKPFNRFSNKFYVYENGTVDIDTRNFVTQSQLNAAIATVSDSDAKLDDDNEFTKKNTFAVNTNADFTVRQNEGAYFNVRPNNIDMLMGANNASIGLHNTDLKLAFGKPDNQATITFGQVPGGYNGVKFQSRGASYFDTEVVVDDEHTLSWGTDPDNYPWHYHDNEYITKGWADGAYGGQSSGTPEWNNVQHKPFSTIGTGLTVSNNVLSATATAPAWGEVTSKPFTSIGTGLMVTGDVLSATAATPTWATTTGKPFSSIGQGLIVTADELSTLTTWSEVTSKPFSSIGSGLSVVNNTLTAPTPTWATTTGKPFNTLDLANSFIVIDGELGTRQTVPFWSSVFNKPFESIGAGLSVNGGVLSADASGDFMKLAGGNTFTGAQTGTLANYEAFKLTGSGTNQMYFNLTPGKDFRAGDNFSYINVDSSAVSLFANSGTNYATFYAYPAGNIFSRADKGFVLDGDVVINTGHKLGWNSVASSTYPTPTANSEYVTKGWTDLTYLKKGGVGWADVTSKPFNSIGDGLAVTDGVLSATGGGGATTWEQVSGKPFNGVGWGLDVVGNNIVSAVTWDKLLEKPFKTVGDGLNISDEGVLVTSWSWLPGKPFSYIGSGLSVAVPSGALIAIPAWTAVTSKPFNSIGSGLSVEVPSGALTATPAWTAVTSKPFSYIGSGLTVEVPSGELTATPAWTAVTSKPFNSIGDGLSVTGGVLSVKPNTYLQYNTSTDQTPLQIKQTVDSYQKLFLMQENEIELVSTNVGQHSESYVILQPHRLVLGCGIPDCMIVVRSTGITVDGPLVTTSTSTTAPASNEFITKEYADGRYALKNGGADKSTGSLHDILQDVAIAVLSLLLGRKKIASAFRNFRGRQ